MELHNWILVCAVNSMSTACSTCSAMFFCCNLYWLSVVIIRHMSSSGQLIQWPTNIQSMHIAQVELLTMIIFALQSSHCYHGNGITYLRASNKFIYTRVFGQMAKVFDLFVRADTPNDQHYLNSVRSWQFVLCSSEIGAVSAVASSVHARQII